jgi:hypothetical protein
MRLPARRRGGAPSRGPRLRPARSGPRAPAAMPLNGPRPRRRRSSLMLKRTRPHADHGSARCDVQSPLPRPGNPRPAAIGTLIPGPGRIGKRGFPVSRFPLTRNRESGIPPPPPDSRPNRKWGEREMAIWASGPQNLPRATGSRCCQTCVGGLKSAFSRIKGNSLAPGSCLVRTWDDYPRFADFRPNRGFPDSRFWPNRESGKRELGISGSATARPLSRPAHGSDLTIISCPTVHSLDLTWFVWFEFGESYRSTEHHAATYATYSLLNTTVVLVTSRVDYMRSRHTIPGPGNGKRDAAVYFPATVTAHEQ